MENSHTLSLDSPGPPPTTLHPGTLAPGTRKDLERLVKWALEDPGVLKNKETSHW